MNNEKNIINDLADGKEDAYKFIYDNYYNILCHYSLQYVKDNYIAESIVGEVIFQLWSKRSILVITQSLRSYLIQSVKNRCINYLKEQRNQDKLKKHVGEKIIVAELDYESFSEYPLAVLQEKELDQKIEKALNLLPPITRTIFELSRDSNLTYAEIADRTQKSINTVKYHIKSALAILRNELQDYLTLIIIVVLLKFQ